MIEIVIISLVGFLLFAWYMGLFHKLEISETKFSGGHFIYYDYQGHINNALKFHQILQKEMGSDIDFKDLNPLTIIYDDPFNL